MLTVEPGDVRAVNGRSSYPSARQAMVIVTHAREIAAQAPTLLDMRDGTRRTIKSAAQNRGVAELLRSRRKQWPTRLVRVGDSLLAHPMRPAIEHERVQPRVLGHRGIEIEQDPPGESAS